jgi:hypothetical protein
MILLTATEWQEDKTRETQGNHNEIEKKNTWSFRFVQEAFPPVNMRQAGGWINLHRYLIPTFRYFSFPTCDHGQTLANRVEYVVLLLLLWLGFSRLIVNPLNSWTDRLEKNS